MDFDNLTPELMLSAIEAQGFVPTGALFPLNSYENRVYEVALDDAEPIIAKFYRPRRWTADVILDDHRFVLAADDLEIPVVAPLALQSAVAGSTTLGQTGEYYYALFPKFRGKENVEHSSEDLRWLGRTLARLHNLGAVFQAPHRMTLRPEEYGEPHAAVIAGQTYIPDALRDSINQFLEQCLTLVKPYFTDSLVMLPLHGDCHHGNVLWNHEGPHLLDFDDMLIAPPVQDVWMLLHGSPEDQRSQQEDFLAGYTIFRDFDVATLRLAEPLRTLRMIRHAAWIGERYEEDAFVRAFPYYRQSRYWEEFVQALREQIGTLQELQWH